MRDNFWKAKAAKKKASNPSASFLCLGANEIQRRYKVNLDLDDVEYCKQEGLIAFTSDNSLVMLRNVLKDDDDDVFDDSKMLAA